MSDPIAKWHDEHVNFVRLLDMIESELDRFHGGAMPNYELMLDVMYYMTHYPDVIHHRREDLAFERIRAREPGVAPVIDELVRQHDVLRRDGNALVANLDDIVNGAIRTRESVEEPARAYLQCFRRHMRTEEEELFPAAQRVLRPRDWDEISAAVEHLDDPLFGTAGAHRYGALREQIAREAAR